MNGILGTYFTINPLLQSPEFYRKPICLESQRTMTTQYRTGSHSLRIQTGRWNNERRDLRLCKCNNDEQTVDHMLFSCPNTENTRRVHNYEHLNITSFFEGDDDAKMADILMSIDTMK